MVDLFCHFSVFPWLCLKHCSHYRKQKHVKLQVSTDQSGLQGRGELEAQSCFAPSPCCIVLCYCISVNSINFFLIKKTLKSSHFNAVFTMYEMYLILVLSVCNRKHFMINHEKQRIITTLLGLSVCRSEGEIIQNNKK